MSKTNHISLILGGARSGKSNFAEKLAHQRSGEQGVLYVATLQPYDDEMQGRILRHQESRPKSWRTVEAPYALASSLFVNLQNEKLALIDCLTLWTSNLILQEGMQTANNGIQEDDLASPIEPQEPLPGQTQFNYRRIETDIITELELVVTEARQRNLGLIMVSNEVGMGLVPPYLLGRAYRDLLGRVNQRLAVLTDEVFLVVAGIPVDLKRLSAELSPNM
ncbi:MAG: bifunctional adenosylcobinamide kinase/adenosylcobinamide-phosphate guanylyltransferase [Chloroflexi bacterium]|nr:bifunctional adenosylcobinamide kinase/adenosylcobinamide-phosphate guanylyltransferase [Chloroflexota bacterium]